MNGTKLALGIAAIAISAVALTGCGSADPDPQETSASPEPETSAPVLRAPATSDSKTVTLEIDGGDLPEGDTATIYRYQQGWEEGEADCTDSNVEKREIVLGGGDEPQRVEFATVVGVTHWVLVAGEYVTGCGEVSTTVKEATEVNVYTGTEPSEAGAERQITVEITSTPTEVPVTGTATLLGPWASGPEADAASCETAPEVATAPLDFDYNLVSPTALFTVAPEEPGIYRVIVETVETEQSTAATTCEDGAAAATFIVR